MKTNPRVGTVTYSAKEMQEIQRLLEVSFKDGKAADDTSTLLLVRELSDILGIYMSTMGT